MRLAVLADVHGNADALRAVIADLAVQAPDLVVNLGDCLSGPLWPGETADLLMAQGWPTVRGNHDRWLVAPPDPPGPWEADALPHLSSAHRDWLAGLPPTLVLDDAFLCHGTPSSDTTYWLHHVRPDGSFAPTAAAAAARHAAGIGQPLILCGHTHVAAALRLPSGQMVVNPGSVGCPAYEDDHPVYHRVEAGTPHACYALIDRRGADWDITFRRLPHDGSRAVAAARARGAADWAAALATGALPPV
jgi:diadenosine tetraphosphatase ApaH/serine/threonine PP2A family protein phosphatase